MTLSTRRVSPAALSPDGEILVFAPPILLGFIGAPIALASDNPRRRKSGVRKNWAKRRAYDA